MFASVSALLTLALALSAQAAPSYPLPFRSSRLQARAAVPVEDAPATLNPYYANVAAESGSTHQYSEVYITPQYYVVPPSGVSYTPEDRFTTLMASDGSSAGYLIYGYGGQSTTLIQPTTKYSITNPAVELASFNFPAVAAGSAPVTVTSYLFKEPAGGVNKVIFSRGSFDVEKYREAAGLGDALGVNTIYVINGQAGTAASSAATPASSSTASAASSSMSQSAPAALSSSSLPAPAPLSSSSSATKPRPTGVRPGQPAPPYYSVLPVLTKPMCK